jgi:hypothetical protein
LAGQSDLCKAKGESPAQHRGDFVTIRSDAALTRRVTGGRLVMTLAVLGGTLGLAGLGVVGNLHAGPADLGSPALVTVELSQAAAHH